MEAPNATPQPDAGVQSEAFLSGQGIPVALRDVEDELARLWGPSATRADGPEIEHPTVTRVSLANLVVVRLDNQNPGVDEALDTVVALHPCRVILLRGNADPARRISAEVAAHCQLPAPGHPQVCSERIILGVGPNGHDLLPGAVRPLLESDLPMIVWWACDPRRDEVLRLNLADEASRMLIDLPDPGVDDPALGEVLAPASGCECTRDLAWFGTNRWRELVAQFFDAPGTSSSLRRLAHVEILIAVPHEARPARVGAWLAAWLAGRLKWMPKTRESSGSEIAATFDGPRGAISVMLKHVVEQRVQVATIREVWLVAESDPNRAGHVEESFRVERIPETDNVRIEICSETRCALPRTVRSPEYDESRRVAAALTSRRVDPAYDDALPHVLWLLGVPANG
jgi:glucose-6-phosphate dehydrogenase assembly protein OpcA